MNNEFILTATLHKVSDLRYTPSGTPILEMVLKHESWQEENGILCQIQFELPAKLIGQNAKAWQHQVGEIVTVTGFLAQQNQRINRPVLRIRNITKYRG